MTSLALHLHEEFLHSHILKGDISHVCCHSGDLSGELGIHHHSAISMMMVRSIPTCLGNYCSEDFVIIFLYPPERNITV